MAESDPKINRAHAVGTSSDDKKIRGDMRPKRPSERERIEGEPSSVAGESCSKREIELIVPNELEGRSGKRGWIGDGQKARSIGTAGNSRTSCFNIHIGKQESFEIGRVQDGAEHKVGA